MVFTIISMALMLLKIYGIDFSEWYIFFSAAVALAEYFNMAYQLKKKKEQLKKAVEFADHFREDAQWYRNAFEKYIEASEEDTDNEENIQ